MFKFGLSNKSSVTKSVTKAEEDQDLPDRKEPQLNTSNSEKKSFSFGAELGSGKGWPHDITIIHYHKPKSALLIGTETGSVHSFFDGCQFTWSSSAGEVTHIASIQDDKVLVVFSDSSMEILVLPYLINQPQQSVPKWIPESSGEITTIYIDEIFEKKNFVYIGTSAGQVYVIEISPSFRLCDYDICPTDVGITGEMSISSIATCPKDEKFVAIGYDGPFSDLGAVVIFDLSKHKVHRFFNTAAVTSLFWHSSGDAVFAGTREGDLLLLFLEKQHFLRLWNAAAERVHRDGHPVAINKIHWLPAQTPQPTTASAAASGTQGGVAGKDSLQVAAQPGILTVQLGSADNAFESLHSIVAVLSYSGPQEAKVLLTIPPSPSEDVLRTLLIPTRQHLLSWMDGTASWLRDDENGATSSVPGVLMLTQAEFSDGLEDSEESDGALNFRYIRMLKWCRFPVGGVSEWSGQSIQTKYLTAVHPACHYTTAICGIPISSEPTSLSALLITQIKNRPVFIPKSNDVDDADTSEAAWWAAGSASSLSYTAYLNGAEDADWQPVLGTGVEGAVQQGNRYRPLDILVLGYGDGSVVVWGVSMSKVVQQTGEVSHTGGNIWIPITTLRIFPETEESSRISTIAADHDSGHLLAANSDGWLVLWSTSLKDSRLMNTSKVPSATNSPSTFHDRSQLFEEIFRFEFPDTVTSALIIGSASTLLIGCQSGGVFICVDWSRKSVLPIMSVSRCGGYGAIYSFHLNQFWCLGELVPVVYISWESGHVGIMNLHTREIVGFFRGASREVSMESSHANYSSQASSLCQMSVVMTEQWIQCEKPEDLSVPPPDVAEDSPPPPTEPSEDRSRFSLAHQSPFTPLAGISLPAPNVKKFGQSFVKKMKNIENKIDSGLQQLAKPPAPIDMKKLGHDVKNLGANIVKKITTDPIEQASNLPPPIPAPSDAPRYLVQAAGNTVLTTDLSKISSLSTTGKFYTAAANAVQTIVVSPYALVAAQVVYFLEEATRAWSDPIACLLCVDVLGHTKILSLKDGVFLHSDSSLHGLIGETSQLTGGVISSTGNIYVRNHMTMVYSMSLNSSQLIQMKTTPSRSIPVIAVPPKSFQLKHGRETITAKKKSIFGGGFDLDKLFSKTKEQRMKEELTGRDQSEDREEPAQTSTLDRTGKSTSRVRDVMSETRQAFDERGDRLERLAEKTGDFQNQAMNYKAATAALKDKMKQKEKRWGLF